MYVAMNRFRVPRDKAEAFEALWLNRDSHLTKEPGFKAFHMLRGPERDDHILYCSHSVWADETAFMAWTKSAAFRAAHKDAGDTKSLYDGPPEFEGFTAIQEITA